MFCFVCLFFLTPQRRWSSHFWGILCSARVSGITRRLLRNTFLFFSSQTDSVLMRLFGSTYSSELDAESPLAPDSSTFKTSVSAKPSFLFLSLWFSRSSVRLLSSSRSHSSVRRLVFQAEHGAVDRCDAFLKPAFWNLLAEPLGLLPWHLTKIKIWAFSTKMLFILLAFCLHSALNKSQGNLGDVTQTCFLNSFNMLPGSSIYTVTVHDGRPPRPT